MSQGGRGEEDAKRALFRRRESSKPKDPISGFQPTRDPRLIGLFGSQPDIVEKRKKINPFFRVVFWARGAEKGRAPSPPFTAETEQQTAFHSSLSARTGTEKKTTAGKSNSGFFSGVESGGWKKEGGGGSYSKGGRKGRPRRKRNSPDSFRLTGRRTNGQGTEETELPFLRREEREEGGRRSPTATSLYSPCPCVRASPSTSPPPFFARANSEASSSVLRPPSSARPLSRAAAWEEGLRERWVYTPEREGGFKVFSSLPCSVETFPRTNGRTRTPGGKPSSPFTVEPRPPHTSTNNTNTFRGGAHT